MKSWDCALLALLGLLPADPVDHVVGDGNDIEIAVGTLDDTRRRAEALADDQRLAFGGAELIQVVGDVIGEPGIGAHVYVEAICGQMKAVQGATGTADLSEAATRAYPQRPVVLGPKRCAADERGTGRRHVVQPAEFGIPVD